MGTELTLFSTFTTILASSHNFSKKIADVSNVMTGGLVALLLLHHAATHPIVHALSLLVPCQVW